MLTLTWPFHLSLLLYFSWCLCCSIFGPSSNYPEVPPRSLLADFCLPYLSAPTLTLF